MMPPMDRENAAVQAADDEAKRLVALLDSLVRLSKRSQRELEREFGFGNGVLSKILSGQISPKLQHALLIAIGLGMTPADFFEVAYPDLRRIRNRHPLAQKLRATEGWTVHEGPVDDELDERIEAAVERALQRRNA